LPEKNRNCFKISLEKSKSFENLPGKIEMLFARIHDPQISNQIDAAALGKAVSACG